MRRWHATGLLVALAVTLPAGAVAGPCDEHDPAAPSARTRITLTDGDATDPARDELRTFVATGSLGKVTAAVIDATPKGIVRSFSAAPAVSRASPLYGEALKGIEVRVTLTRGDPAAVVWLSLRQVCAQYFKDTFLYY